MIKYVKADADNSTILEEVADLIIHWGSGIVGDWRVVTNKLKNDYYSDIYYRDKLVAFVYWDETLYTFTTDKEILNQLHNLNEFEVYEEAVDCSNPIDNVYMAHTLSLMSMIEAYFLTPTKELAEELIYKFQNYVYYDGDNYDDNWDGFDRWLSKNGISMLDGENMDYGVLPHDLLEVYIPTRYNRSPAIYRLNVVAEFVERF